MKRLKRLSEIQNYTRNTIELSNMSFKDNVRKCGLNNPGCKGIASGRPLECPHEGTAAADLYFDWLKVWNQNTFSCFQTWSMMISTWIIGLLGRISRLGWVSTLGRVVRLLHRIGTSTTRLLLVGVNGLHGVGRRGETRRRRSRIGRHRGSSRCRNDRDIKAGWTVSIRNCRGCNDDDKRTIISFTGYEADSQAVLHL